jgi:CheY-like chemotaxis protein
MYFFAGPPHAVREESSMFFCSAENEKPRVLIAGDLQATNRLSLILHNTGFEAITSHDGLESIRLAHAWRPDVLLSDVRLPQLDGIEAAILISAMISRCAVLLLSAPEDVAHLRRRAQHHGYTFEMVLKPIRPEALLSRLRAMAEDVQWGCQCGAYGLFTSCNFCGEETPVTTGAPFSCFSPLKAAIPLSVTCCNCDGKFSTTFARCYFKPSEFDSVRAEPETPMRTRHPRGKVARREAEMHVHPGADRLHVTPRDPGLIPEIRDGADDREPGMLQVP